ncbi:CPBP family glutamic-type intramembrane protease [Nocardiopsis potens]|uniref:CPBP family glutamic-type intramembrane protease n=1 Tax=Nocardiopsis potens TaxID=1246458 RepID=UPI000347B63C|nr:CPBP family glutamic-type intramembrane protease [Nocardiopsis potens]
MASIDLSGGGPATGAESRVGRIIGGTAAAVFAACILAHLLGGGAGEGRAAALFWAGSAAGVLLIRLLPPRAPEAGMLARVRARAAGHPVAAETAVLLGCAAAFAGAYTVLTPLFGAIGPAAEPLAYYTAKIIFLLLFPLLFAGGSGLMRRSSGPDLPDLALRVHEPWRWAGLPVALLAPLTFAAPWAPDVVLPGGLPGDHAVGAALLVSYIGITAAEVLFFAVLLQTRLELLLGRRPAILLTALLYALLSLVGRPVAGGPDGLADAVALLGVGAVLSGYMWSRHRNAWSVLAMHGLLTTFAVLPGGVFAVTTG